MAHILASLEKLGKPGIVRLVMDYQNKFDTVLNKLLINGFEKQIYKTCVRSENFQKC